MKLTIIDELLKAVPKRRKKILTDMHARNLAYFRKHAPASLANELAALGSGRFEIRLNDTFLDILDRRAGGTFCHPPGRLLDYVTDLGSWHHTAWIDRLSVTHAYLGDEEHSDLRKKFISGIYDHIPELEAHWKTGQVMLPRLSDGRRYSGATLFLGIYSGLHIVQYLNRTEVKDVIFFEPDMECLALSCFFLDYGAIHKRFGRVVLHAGGNLPEDPIDYLVRTCSVTSSVWLRMLPAYPSGLFDEIIRRVSIRWNAFHEIRVPFDRELRNLTYGAMNLKAKRPVLAAEPALSESSRIAIVGSGPSLQADLSWLKKNQDKLIIISAHSAVRVLKKEGIKPDYQCTLDTEIDEPLLQKLEMYPDVPLLVYYKANPEMIKGFDKVLLFPEENKANVADFNLKLNYTHPTSGNSAVALAVCFRPAVIYLLGMDLGFRDASQSHAAGTWHDDEGGAGHAATQMSDVLPADANFESSKGQILTYSYLNTARAGVEAALGSLGEGVRVANLSDGVAIAHANPAHSEDEHLPDYPEKTLDLQAIEGAFETDLSRVCHPYDWSASAALEYCRGQLLDIFRPKQFDWLQFARAVDLAWPAAATRTVQQGRGDFRVEAFSKLVLDILTDWYRALCHTRTPSEAQRVYETGQTGLAGLLEALRFPHELDSIALSHVALPSSPDAPASESGS